MARQSKSHTVSVEIELLRDQFDKDYKQAGRDVATMQRQLSLEMERNKVRFAIDKADAGWADKLFGHTVIGKIAAARKETEQLNTQLGFQRNKVDIARAAWEGVTKAKGAMSWASVQAERAMLREQQALVKVQKELKETSSASGVAASALKTYAVTLAAFVAAVAGGFGAATKVAVDWGQAVNDVVDETGMADVAAARLLGTMQVVGISSEEAAGALAKLAKNVAAANKEQREAAKAGKEAEDVFTKYKIAIKGSDGQLLGHEAILKNIIGVHRDMADGLEKTAMEMEIFGKSGYKFNDLLNLSDEKLKDYAEMIDKLGLSVKDSQKYEDFNRELNKMQLAFKSIANTITEENIPALGQYIDKVTEFAIWFRRNKDALTAIDKDILNTANALLYPVVKSFELARDAVKNYVEARQAAIDQEKKPEAESSLSDVREAAKLAEANAKKQADASRQKITLDKQLKESQRDLQLALLQLQDQALRATLLNIDKEREDWAKKTQDEVAATKWAEAAKTKAIQEAIDSRLGQEVAAAKKAIQTGGDVTGAIYKASESRKKDEQQTFEARKAVQDFYGVKLPGDTQVKLSVDELRGVMTSFKEVVKNLVIPQDRYGKTVFDPYRPTPTGSFDIQLNNQFTITVDPATPNLFADVAQKAAGLIDAQVRQRLDQLPTGYGGNRP